MKLSLAEERDQGRDQANLMSLHDDGGLEVVGPFYPPPL